MIEGKGVISSMKKHMMTAAALLLVGAFVASVCTLTGCSCTGKNQKAASSTAAASTLTGKTYQTSNVLSCESWIGKLTTQVGMGDYVSTTTGEKRIEIEGKLFDTDASGYAHVDKNGDVIASVTLNAESLAYDTAKSELQKLYGDPLKSEDTSCEFRAGSNTAILTQKDSGVSLTIR